VEEREGGWGEKGGRGGRAVAAVRGLGGRGVAVVERERGGGEPTPDASTPRRVARVQSFVPLRRNRRDAVYLLDFSRRVRVNTENGLGLGIILRTVIKDCRYF